MTSTIADGPAGLEGIHTWQGLALNDLTDRTVPFVRFTEIDGLYGLPEADDLRDPKTGRQGEVPRPGFPRGKSTTYAGIAFAPSLQALRAYTTAIRAAFSERAYEHPMIIAPRPGDDGPSWRFDARVLSCDIPEKQDVGMSALPTPWQRVVTVTLRLSDGRFVLVADPVDDGPFASAATETVTVEGTADTDPVFTGTVVAGDDVLLENYSIPIASGGHAFLRFFNVPASGALNVDFAARSAYIVDGASATWDLAGSLDSTSNWQDEQVPGLLPGDNSVQVTGAANWHVAHTTRSW